MVPHLTTALTGPINELEARILESMPAIERWFRLEWMEHTPAFYAAVDLRNAGFKLAPVDTDLFPDVFGNLTAEMLPLAVQAAMAAIEKICPEAKNLLLVPDGRTHNSFYLASVQRLLQIFTQAGLNVRLGSPDETLKAPQVLVLPDGSELVLEPLLRTRGRLGLKDFDPCTILLNNDLRGRAPAALQGLHEQYLLPPLHAGWGVRRKSRHFQSYEEVAKKFAKLLGMDPWLIVPMFARCGEVALDRPEGLEAIKAQADAMLAKVRRKYKEYGIGERPFVVVKSDDASGAGVLTVRDAKDLDDPARRERCRLLSAPGASRPAPRGGSGRPAEPDRPEAPGASRPAPRGGSGRPAEPDRLEAPGASRSAPRGGSGRPAEPDRPEAKGDGSAELIVQEGVPTYERINDAVAEPVVVTIDRYVVGGFYRVHAERGADENLNAPGSSYVPLAFDQASQLPRPGARPGASAPNRFYMYGVIGRLAMLAAAYELEATDPEAEVYE